MSKVTENFEAPKVIITLIFLLTHVCSLLSQTNNFQKISPNIYSDGVDTARLHHFEHIFIEDSELHEQFQLFDKSRRTQRKINHVCLGVGVVGVAGWLIVKEKTDYARFPKPAIAAIVAGFIVAPATMIVSNIIITPTKIKRKKNLLKAYRSNQNINTNQSLGIGVSENGIGLMWSF